MTDFKARIFSGVQPSGDLHLGNYLGAIRNFVALQDSYECLFCVVDLHALTIWQKPEVLRHNCYEVAAAFLAAGIDAKKHIIFNQSRVSAHAELAWIFNCVARIGWFNRMTQFKEKTGKNRENASVGLYVYPALMAADILIYHATHVPVGDDQIQHLELVNDIAQKFNHDFIGADRPPFFPPVERLGMGDGARIMSLRDGTRKMSKSESSAMSRISLLDDSDAIAQKIRKAKTDSEPLPDTTDGLASRPEAANLLGIYAALSGEPIADVVGQFAGENFSAFKPALAELAVARLAPIGDEMRRLLADTAYLDGLLADGAARADAIALPILRQVKELVGFPV